MAQQISKNNEDLCSFSAKYECEPLKSDLSSSMYQEFGISLSDSTHSFKLVGNMLCAKSEIISPLHIEHDNDDARHTFTK